jgi:hypothetical protein
MVLMHISAAALDLMAAAAVPNPTPAAPAPLVSLGSLFISWLKWILIICGFGGLLVCGIMMVVGRRNRSQFAADGAAGIPWVLGGLTLGSVGAAIVGVVLPG